MTILLHFNNSENNFLENFKISKYAIIFSTSRTYKHIVGSTQYYRIFTKIDFFNQKG